MEGLYPSQHVSGAQQLVTTCADFYVGTKFQVGCIPSYLSSLKVVIAQFLLHHSDCNQQWSALVPSHFVYFIWYFLGAVVILVPTRELALQTSQVCKELGKHLNIQVMVTTGGTSLKDDIMRLYQPVHLLVGTPGRILDLSKKGVCILKDCSMLVMDEVNAWNFNAVYIWV